MVSLYFPFWKCLFLLANCFLITNPLYLNEGCGLFLSTVRVSGCNIVVGILEGKKTTKSYVAGNCSTAWSNLLTSSIGRIWSRPMSHRTKVEQSSVMTSECVIWGGGANQKKFYIWNLDDLQAYKREPRLWLAVVGPASPTQLSHLLPTMSSSWHLGRCLIHHRGNTEQLNPFNSWALIPMNSLTIELLTRVLSFAHRGLFACLDMCNNVSIHPAFGRFEQ